MHNIYAVHNNMDTYSDNNKMQQEFQDIIHIKELLKKFPLGLNITEISNALHMHRNTCAKYLDMMRIKGDIDKKQSGTAKNYFLLS